jgi:hypothetical protein
MAQKGENSNWLYAVLWALLVLLMVSLVSTIGVLWWVRSRTVKNQTLTITANWRASTTAQAQEPTSFAELNEANVVGRYRIVDGAKVSFVYLNEDHTFINTDGTTYQQYQWEAGPDRLVLTYQRGSSTYTTFERAGVYSRRKPEGGMMRMEKLPDLPPAETISFPDEQVVASLRPGS